MLRPVNSAQNARILRLSYVQLALYVATWLAGIYINGFVPIPSDNGGSVVTFFLSQAVITHFLLAALTATVGIMLLASGWIFQLKRFTILTGISLASIAIAGTGGLSFVFGIGDSNLDSVLMATCFITAVYLSFLAILNLNKTRFPEKMPQVSKNLSVATLALFYLVFVSGIYLNLYVASSVFSEPPAVEQKMLGQLVTSPTALFHETSGTLLLLMMIFFTIGLFRSFPKKFALRALIATILVLYSLLVGAFENIEPVLVPASLSIESAQNGLAHLLSSEVIPLLSAAGFLAALVILMSVVHEMRKQVSLAVKQ
jgi:hypothetical protein